MVSDYLQRESLNALPSSQRNLMTLVLRKLLASSTFAIAGALNSLANKLEKQLKEDEARAELAEADVVKESGIESDFETFDQLVDEFMSGEDEEDEDEPLTAEQRAAIKHEIVELRQFYQQAVGITENAKGISLLSGLKVGFKMTNELGGAEKAIIFTESRKTQDYLVRLLSEKGYADQIVLFNGTNNDQKSKEIYAAWKEKHAGTDKASGARAADIRAALVDYFRDEAKIMIATEAASEGINLQFCSMVVNYDLPWNPQRIEQRIGRCHRYGQKHDVVVVNFLNKNNAADQRVYELLSEKFQLFDGVFGASDEILGSIESGVDFEKRIAEIYQTCRTTKEIQSTFDFLQSEMSEQIDETMQSARTKLLENFDAEVAEKLNVFKEKSVESVNRFESLLWDVTQFMLKDKASFDESTMTFDLANEYACKNGESTPADLAPVGKYSIKRRDDIAHHYRFRHPMAISVLSKACKLELPLAKVQFDYTETRRQISTLEPLVGQSGWLIAKKLSISSLEAEDHILLAGFADDGTQLEPEQAKRLFNLPGTIVEERISPSSMAEKLNNAYDKHRVQLVSEIMDRNADFFDEEVEKLDRWSNDLKQGLEGEIKDLDREIREAKKSASLARSLNNKLEIQKQVKQLEATRKEKRNRLFDAEDEIDNRRDGLISETEQRLQVNESETELFTIRWQVT